MNLPHRTLAPLLLLFPVAALATPPLFPADNPWNQPITSAPVAANSAAIMSSIIGTFGNNRLHPDFGQAAVTSANPLYGIPYNIVQGSTTPRVSVVIDAYPTQSDRVDCPIPANAILEGDRQNGPTVGLSARGDSHLIVWDQESNIVYEFYRASRPSENADGRWHADAQAVWDMNANTFRTLGWTSADAAGLPILAGLVRPDEALPVAQGGQGIIRHPIRFTLTNSVILHKYIYPASHVANPGNTNAAIQPPMGSRFRLKASVNITGLDPQSRVIAQAMKDYGLILADNGSNFFFTGTSFAMNAQNQPMLSWNDDDIQSTARGLKSLRFADFEVVDLTPQVTSLSAPSAPPGATLTISGLNFSGAAGRLAVLFGSTPSPSVTYISDSQLAAVVPAGAGAVDLRVRSGLVVAPSTQNLTSPIFGYGLSPITAAARFTFSSACIADFNASGTPDIDDLFLYLNAWFQSDPRADVDNLNGVAIDDLFLFLNAWFEGCP